MHFLLSNDDGYQAQGIAALAAALNELGRVSVVAPDRDRSGASNSLTLDAPLYVKQDNRGFNYVNGTPADCVHLALTGLFLETPDMVISGINSGPNLGSDVLYSGTVAAAMEGYFLGVTSLAFSLAADHPDNYEEAVKAAMDVVRMVIDVSLEENVLLNINIPYLKHDAIKAYQVTRLGNRHKSGPAQGAFDPKGRKIYWVGPVGAEQDAGEGTDFYAIRDNSVSITPLQMDLTHYGALSGLTKWVGEIGI